jgi:hypothetical protein
MLTCRFAFAVLTALMSAAASATARGSGPILMKSGIKVTASRQISKDNPKSPHVECHLAVNPRNPLNMIASSAFLYPNGNSGSHVYYTVGGGKHWTRGKLLGDTTMYNGIDATVHFNDKNTAFFVSLAYPKGVKHAKTMISRSTDGGRT